MNGKISIQLTGFCVAASMTYGMAIAGDTSIVDTCVKAAQAQFAEEMIKMEKSQKEKSRSTNLR